MWRSIAFIWKGIRGLLHGKLDVEVLDALSVTASLLRGDYSTAGSVMLLLTVSSLLEEGTFNSHAAVFTELIEMSGLSNAHVERLVGSGDP